MADESILGKLRREHSGQDPIEFTLRLAFVVMTGADIQDGPERCQATPKPGRTVRAAPVSDSPAPARHVLE